MGSVYLLFVYTRGGGTSEGIAGGGRVGKKGETPACPLKDAHDCCDLPTNEEERHVVATRQRDPPLRVCMYPRVVCG